MEEMLVIGCESLSSNGWRLNCICSTGEDYALSNGPDFGADMRRSGSRSIIRSCSRSISDESYSQRSAVLTVFVKAWCFSSYEVF